MPLTNTKTKYKNNIRDTQIKPNTHTHPPDTLLQSDQKNVCHLETSQHHTKAATHQFSKQRAPKCQTNLTLITFLYSRPTPQPLCQSTRQIPPIHFQQASHHITTIVKWQTVYSHCLTTKPGPHGCYPNTTQTSNPMTEYSQYTMPPQYTTHLQYIIINPLYTSYHKQQTTKQANLPKSLTKHQPNSKPNNINYTP